MANFISLSALTENFIIHDSELFHIFSKEKYFILKYVGVQTHRSKNETSSNLYNPFKTETDQQVGFLFWWNEAFPCGNIKTLTLMKQPSAMKCACGTIRNASLHTSEKRVLHICEAYTDE